VLIPLIDQTRILTADPLKPKTPMVVAPQTTSSSGGKSTLMLNTGQPLKFVACTPTGFYIESAEQPNLVMTVSPSAQPDSTVYLELRKGQPGTPVQLFQLVGNSILADGNPNVSLTVDP